MLMISTLSRILSMSFLVCVFDFLLEKKTKFIKQLSGGMNIKISMYCSEAALTHNEIIENLLQTAQGNNHFRI